jgi:hypothetical protein
MRQNRLGEVQHPKKVDIKLASDFLFVQRFNRAKEAVACIIDKNVNVSVAGDEVIDNFREVGSGSSNFQLDEMSILSITQALGKFGQRSGCGDDSVAIGERLLDYAKAEARVGTCDEPDELRRIHVKGRTGLQKTARLQYRMGLLSGDLYC